MVTFLSDQTSGPAG